VSVGHGEGQTHCRGTDLLHRAATGDGVTYGGGGAKFQAFLTQELRPFLEVRWTQQKRSCLDIRSEVYSRPTCSRNLPMHSTDL